MKLYQSIGPNPRVPLMFIEEKGITIDRQLVDLMGGENRKEDYLKTNPFGQTPALELDDGTALFESVAICEYLEELHPEPALIGSTAEERAQTRMLIRRIDFDVVMPMTTAFRASEGLALFQDRMRCVPEGADGLKACARDGLAGFEKWLGDSTWLAGDRFTLADIVLFCFVDFGAQVGQPLPGELSNLAGWLERVSGRDSATASANPELGL